MKVENVKVIATDEFGPRSIEIKTDKLSFSTPARAITSTESNYKKYVRTLDDPYDNSVFEVVNRFTPEKLKMLYKKNGPFGKRKAAISSHIRGYEDVITKFLPQIKKDTKLSSDDIFTLVDLQKHCGFDLITIPDFSSNSPVDQFDRLINKISDNFILPYAKAEPMPYIDMAMDFDLFKKKVDMIFDNNFNIMGLIYRSPLQYYANYTYLRKNVDRNIWIHASGVPRYYSYSRPTSQMHIPQIYGIDTVSVLSQRAMGESEPKPVEEIRRYDKNTLGIIHTSEHRDKYKNNLNCNCPVCNGKTLDTAIAEYTINHKKEQDNSLLGTWWKIHEAFSSYNEFGIGRDFIKKQEFENYFTEKEYVKKILPEIHPKQ